MNTKEYKRRLDLIKKLAKNRVLLDSNLEIGIYNAIYEGFIWSQNFQDLKALMLCKNKRGGFYVEFGADDGKKNSNSYYLKEIYGWNGILVEPNPDVFDELVKNRCGEILSDDLIFHTNGLEVKFLISGQLSTIEEYVSLDFNASARLEKDTNYIIKKSITLTKLLDKYNAPSEIDFISVDTEGSEFEILSCFDFEKYKVNLFCVEHNNNSKLKEKLRNLFVKHNFQEIVFDENDLDSFYLNKL